MPIQNDFKKKIVLKMETLKDKAANIFPGMPTSIQEPSPSPAAQPLPLLRLRQASTPLPTISSTPPVFSLTQPFTS